MLSHTCCSCFARRNSGPFSHIFIPRLKSQREEQIGSIDAEISRTEDAIVMLVRQRVILKRKRNACSPAVNLPPELLALIFEYACLPRHPNDSILDDDTGPMPGSMHVGLSTGSGAVTPFFIGMVCFAWRQVSRNASQLWNNITIRIRNRHSEAQAELLRCWLAHASVRPLSIKVLEEEEADDDELDGWGLNTPSTEIIDVLADHAQQWHTVDMFLPVAWKRTLGRVVRSLPLLTHLTLRLTESSPSMGYVSIFAAAPALREATLVGYGVTDVDLPWAQLTHLEAECFSAHEAYEALRLCSDIRRCQLEQLYRGMAPFTPTPFTHLALETLELVVDSVVGLGPLLGALTLPRLRNLVLALPDESETPMMQWVLPLLKRSACELRKLHLVGVTPREEELVQCLRAVPTLTTLLLLNPRAETGGKLTGRVLDLMNPAGAVNSRWRDSDCAEEYEYISPQACVARLEGKSRDDERPLIPRLERLVYQGPITFTPHALVHFLLSRWHTCPSSPNPPSEVSGAGSSARAIYRTGGNSAVGIRGEVHTDARGPATARLRSAIFTTPTQIRFEGEDREYVQALLRDGMHLQFLVDPNADT